LEQKTGDKMSLINTCKTKKKKHGGFGWARQRKLAQIWKICETILKKSIILTCYTNFALISTDFDHQGCNFTLKKAQNVFFLSIVGGRTIKYKKNNV
jgi:hypothetical protein